MHIKAAALYSKICWFYCRTESNTSMIVRRPFHQHWCKLCDGLFFLSLQFCFLQPFYRIWIWKVWPGAPLTFHQHYCELWIANLAFDSNYFEWRACHPFEFPTMILTQAELWLQPLAQWVTSDTRVPVNNSLSARTLPANKSPSNRNFLVHSI